MLKPLLNLINLSIRESKFPSNWKTSIITPIFKAGSVNEDYRPITIHPVISKILEKLVAEQLINCLKKKKKIYFTLNSLVLVLSIQQKWQTAISQKFLREL